MSQLARMIGSLKTHQVENNLSDETMIKLLDDMLDSRFWHIDQEDAPTWMRYKEPEDWRVEQQRLRIVAITKIWRNGS